LGVVRVAEEASFVIADIPGLIEGAAAGHGLGTQFLRHLSRTRVILHLVEVRPLDESSPLQNVELIERELAEYSSAMSERETWIVLTKIDELEDGEIESLLQDFHSRFPRRRIFAISAMADLGLGELKKNVMSELALMEARLKDEEGYQDKIKDLEKRISGDVLSRSNMERDAIAQVKEVDRLEEQADGEPEVVYVKD
jgi:GTP-binding protein